MNTLCPLIVSELFGMRFFSENFALVAMVSATGSSFVFATALFGTLYDHEVQAANIASASSAGGKGRECFGAVCVRRAALVGAGCCAAAAVLSLALLQRQQRQQRGQVAKLVAVATATA
jgi:hypothetical protein